MKKLDPAGLCAALVSLPAWTYRDERGGVMVREFLFKDFVEAFGFMSQASLYAEKHNHHPEWSNLYNRVSVLLTTHDVDGLSLNDIAMARFLDRIAAPAAADSN